MWRRAEDYLGWNPQGKGQWFYGLRVISGRIKDCEQQRLRSGLRTLIHRFHPEVRLTAQQNVLLVGCAANDRPGVNRMLRAYGIAGCADLPPVLRQSLACPALPPCGQALTEAERVWPQVANRIQDTWDVAGMSGQPLCVRITGCPNGCARPYPAEIGIVGQSRGLYSLYLGGSLLGTRLAELFAHGIRIDDVAAGLTPLFERYAAERGPEERFGDWAFRRGGCPVG